MQFYFLYLELVKIFICLKLLTKWRNKDKGHHVYNVCTSGDWLMLASPNQFKANTECYNKFMCCNCCKINKNSVLRLMWKQSYNKLILTVNIILHCTSWGSINNYSTSFYLWLEVLFCLVWPLNIVRSILHSTCK